MLKVEMAQYLAENEISVRMGIQRKQYWVNHYMTWRKADLELMLDAATSPNADEAKQLRSRAIGRDRARRFSN
jgi:hypothetical protein